MSKGYDELWPEMVSDLLAKREYGLEFTGMTDYFRFLDEFLDNQLDPSAENKEPEYEAPPEEPPEEPPIENEIPSNVEKKPENEPETHENIVENVIDTGDSVYTKQGTDTSAVGVMEIKNPVHANANERDNPQEAAYSTYWWIGIVVAVAIVVLLIAIIARKRHSHRKQLERQRRDTSCA